MTNYILFNKTGEQNKMNEFPNVGNNSNMEKTREATFYSTFQPIPTEIINNEFLTIL